ncbi:uncharacterized protein JCM15063_002089 [Sporobolomyces koalae]|uniref:uncharacterized protein n=1 Tax=Sporobolomyces koalae TaxID=500713 RepID=UPI00316CE6B5
MTSPLLFVPKKVTQDVDFAPSLRSVIAKTYGESPDTYAEELAQLNRVRQDALRGSAGSDATARDLLYKYFGQLELLELRFPDLRVPFPWSDAFTHVKISQQSLAYEKASVIFNIGATLSSLAASSPRTSPEGLKRAFHALRAAAGMFVYINDNFLHAPSTDLSKEVVKILVGLMTAQAIEVFIETMGPATAKGAGLRSKMSMQASAAYAAIVEESKEWVTKGVFLKEWSLLIQTKAKYFASLSQYNRSIADTTAGKYGEALARLQLCESSAKEALRLGQQFSSTFSTTSTSTSLSTDSPTSLLELVKTHQALVSDARTKAQKDNDIVYNEVVPTEASLTAIDKGKPVADPIPIHDVYASPEVQKIVGPDLFQKLVPLSVHESASMYSEEKAKLVRHESERVELADEELASALEYMGLPASLVRFKSNDNALATLSDPGPQVRTWVDQVRTGEIELRVEDMFRKIGTLREHAKTTIERISNDLDQESRECEHMRSKYGHLWEQAPSSSSTRSFRQDIKSHRESLEQAATSDLQTKNLWNECRNEVSMMIEPSGTLLEQTFLEAVTKGQGGNHEVSLLDADFAKEEGQDQETKRQAEAVSEALVRLNKIKKERAENLKDLKDKVQSDDISHILILNRKGSAALEPSLFATELEKFRPHQQRLTQTLAAQQSVLSEINSGFKALTEGPRAREAQGKWAAAERNKKDLVNRLGRAAQTYRDVRVALGKGLGFYGDLDELVSGLQQHVSTWLSQRNSERSRMAGEADLKQRLEGGGNGLDRGMNGLNLGATSSLPPPPASSYSPSSMSTSRSPPPLGSDQTPYGNLPSTGAFSLSSPPPRAPPVPTTWNSSAYCSAPPPVPPTQPSYSSQQSSSSTYNSTSSRYGSSYPHPSPSSIPPPPAPVNSSYGLPPPPPPSQPSSISYGSQSYQSTTTPQPSNYGNYSNAPPPQPLYGQYGQQPQHGQQQQQPPASNYRYQQPPPPPSRPYY